MRTAFLLLAALCFANLAFGLPDVSPKGCEKINMEYSESAPAYPDFCGMDTEAQYAQYTVIGCVCKKGHVLENSKSNRCIRREACPKV